MTLTDLSLAGGTLASKSSQHAAVIAIVVILGVAIVCVVVVAIATVLRDASTGFARTLRGGEFRGQMVGVTIGAFLVIGLGGTALGLNPVVAFLVGLVVGLLLLPFLFS